MKTITLFLMLAVSCFSEESKQTELDFKGVKLGASGTKVVQDYKGIIYGNLYFSEDSSSIIYSESGIRCDDDTIANVHAKALFWIAPDASDFASLKGLDSSFREASPEEKNAIARSKLYMITVDFNTDDFDRIEAALEEKYGQPLKMENEVLQNAMGAKYPNIIYTWMVGKSLLKIKQRSDKIDHGELKFVTPDLRPKIDFSKKDAKDL